MTEEYDAWCFKAYVHFSVQYWKTAMADYKQFIYGSLCLITNLLFSQTYGSLLKSLCRIEHYELYNFPSCPCFGMDPHCNHPINRYYCVKLTVRYRIIWAAEHFKRSHTATHTHPSFGSIAAYAHSIWEVKPTFESTQTDRPALKL